MPVMLWRVYLIGIGLVALALWLWIAVDYARGAPPPKRAHPARTVKVWICPLAPPRSHVTIPRSSCFVTGWRRW